MRTKLLTSFIVVSSFWWVVSFILWSSGPYSSNLGAFKDISSLLEGWVNLTPPVDVADTSLWDSWAVQWFVLMYWTGPILFLTALSTGIGSIRVWKHAAEFKKERDSREAAETTAYRGVGCTKGKLPRIGAPLREAHQVEIDGFAPEMNALVSEILSTIHEGYSNGTIFKGDEVEGDWMEYIEEKCQYVLEVSRDKELAMVAALGIEIGKVTAYTSKKGGPGKPIKFTKGGQHKTFHVEGAKQIAKLDSWWKLSPEMRVATVSVLRYLEQPEFMPDGLFKSQELKERVLTAIEDVSDIKPVSQAEPATVSKTTTEPAGRQNTVKSPAQNAQPRAKAEERKPIKDEPKSSGATQPTKMAPPSPVAEPVAEHAPIESQYTAEQVAQVQESLAARFKSLQEQDGVPNVNSSSSLTNELDEVFGYGDFALPPATSEGSPTSAQREEDSSDDSGPPWDEDKAVSASQEKQEVVETPAVEQIKPTTPSPSASTPVQSSTSEPQKSGQEPSQKKKKVVIDNTPADGSFVMTPGAEHMLEPSSLDRHLDKAMFDLWPIMSFHSPNQPKGAQAFGWKQGKRIYLIEIKFREAVAKRIPQDVLEGLSPTTYNEKLNALSRELIAYFIRKGLLVNKIENVVLSAKEPLWKIQAGLYEFNGVFALDVNQEILDMLPTHNSKFQLSVVGCLWSHTIVSGRFHKRDADGKIIEEVPQQRHEKKPRDSKTPQGNKPGYKDPTQMASLPMDLLAPNSGKYKKDTTSESTGSTETAPENTEWVNSQAQRAEKVQAVDHPKQNQKTEESRVDSGAKLNNTKSSKPSGLDLLSLVTSGGKPEKKTPVEAGANNAQKTSKDQRPQNQPKTDNRNPEKSDLAEKSLRNEARTTVVSAPTAEQPTFGDKSGGESKVTVDSNKTVSEVPTENPCEVAKVEPRETSSKVEPSENAVQMVEPKVGDNEETESFSISLTDIVAKADALKAHVPEAQEDDTTVGETSDAEDESSSPDPELDVDSLLSDFANDLEKLNPKPEDKDKP